MLKHYSIVNLFVLNVIGIVLGIIVFLITLFISYAIGSDIIHALFDWKYSAYFLPWIWQATSIPVGVAAYLGFVFYGFKRMRKQSSLGN